MLGKPRHRKNAARQGDDETRARQVENAVQKVLEQGLRTGDIYEEGTKLVSCSEMGDAVLAAL